MKKREKKEGQYNDEILGFFKHVIEILAYMQIKGVEDFQKEWCYDTAIYNREIMIKRESEYFLNSFWYDFLGGSEHPGIGEEFEEISDRAGTGLPHCFLHRDFQCRNIMMVDDDIRIIDFQGGRLGPPGYDLASLLIDPYSNLNNENRDDLFNRYLEVLATYLDFDEKKFCYQYNYLSLQRNLQILGAFSFLLQKRNKSFFKQFIKPSLNMLREKLSEAEMKPYANLRCIVEKAGKRIESML